MDKTTTPEMVTAASGAVAGILTVLYKIRARYLAHSEKKMEHAEAEMEHEETEDANDLERERLRLQADAQQVTALMGNIEQLQILWERSIAETKEVKDELKQANARILELETKCANHDSVLAKLTEAEAVIDRLNERINELESAA